MSSNLYGLPRTRLAAIVCAAAIVPSVLLMAPAIAAQLAAQFALGPGQIGRLFSAELAAMSLATLPAWWWQGRHDWRKAAFAGAALFIVANIASAFVSSYPLLLALRFVSALGGGTVMVVCMASAADSTERDRVYGLWVCGQLLLGALGLWLLPGLFVRFGITALYLGLAVLMAAMLPLLASFPKGAAHRQARAGQAAFSVTRAGLAILALLTFYIGLAGVWTFIGRIGADAGLDTKASGAVLAIASLFGILGALGATAIGARLPRGQLLLVGYSAMTASVLGLLGLPGLARFALAACVFKLVWTFVLPYLLASVADHDRGGRLMSAANLVIGGGLAIGPFLAGNLLESAGGARSMLLTSAGFLVVSIALLLFSRAPALR